MDLPRLIIHVGAPKTGSTLLQQQATRFRELLASRGILYPSSVLRGFGHHDIAFLLDGGFPEWAKATQATLKDLADALSREAELHDGDILLSSENFLLYPQPAKLACFLQDTGLSRTRRVVVLAYLRRQDDLLESWYNQAVKAQGFTGTFEDMIAAPPAFLEFDRGLEAWGDVFGRDAIDCRLYEEACAVGLEHDFWNALQPGLAGLIPPAKAAANTRLDRDFLEVQRIINGLEMTPVQKRGLHREFMTMSAEADRVGAWPLMTPKIRTRIIEKYRESNGRLAQTWFGRDTLYSDVAVQDATDPEYPGLTKERAVEILAGAFLRSGG